MDYDVKEPIRKQDTRVTQDDSKKNSKDYLKYILFFLPFPIFMKIRKF